MKRGVFLAFFLALLPGLANAQEVLTIQELELEYSSRVQRHQAALNAWEVLESRFQRALEELSAAGSLGNSDRRNRAFTISQQLAGEIRIQERRVEELAQELRDSRSALLTARGQRVEDLYQQVDSAVDPQERRELGAILEDANNRYLELRAEEEPETSLEPMQDITIGPRDTPEIILRKAESLEFRANKYEAQLAGIGGRLEELREDQRRTRRVNDFMAGLERYDDTRLLGVPSGSRTVNPPDPAQVPPGADTLGVEVRPMTLEERIGSLELLEEELRLRMQQVRDKAARFRLRAGGGDR
jgi:hypothetical protein